MEASATEPGLGQAVRRPARRRAPKAPRDDVAYEEVLDVALSTLRVDELLPELLERVRRLLRADIALVLFLDGGQLRVRAACGIDEERVRDLAVPVGEGFAGEVMSGMRPLVVREVDEQTAVYPVFLEEGVRSLLGVPLIVEGRPMGVLEVGSRALRDYSEREVRLLQLAAERFAMSIDRARALEAEREQRGRAERASRFKTELLNMAGHDLKTPLTAIELQLLFLEDRPGITKERREKALVTIRRNLRRLRMVLDDVLDLGRIESGSFILHRERFDLGSLAAETAESFALQAADSQQELTWEVRGNLDVEGDQRRIGQVLANLLANAIRYTPRGGRIRVEAFPDGPMATVQVVDTGRGFSREQVRRLFRPFTQVHQSSEEQLGAGLGLYLSRTIVEEHGGTIWVESAGPGQGATVSFQVPRVQPQRRG
jgi:signal transduction histidine kinase